MVLVVVTVAAWCRWYSGGNISAHGFNFGFSSVIESKRCCVYSTTSFSKVWQSRVWLDVRFVPAVLTSPALSWPDRSCPVVSYPVLSCPVLSMSCHLLSCSALLCHVLSCAAFFQSQKHKRIQFKFFYQFDLALLG